MVELAIIGASALILGGSVAISTYDYYNYSPGLHTVIQEGETFGTVVPGFVTDMDGRLIVTATPDMLVYGDIVPGFVTDSHGRVVIFYAT
jgi:hypothetical protein